VPRFLRENSLSIAFGAAFIVTLIAQSYAGYLDNNNNLAVHNEALISYWRFLVSSEFGAAVMENWQSEFLQFSLYIVATVWLVQRGSNESKPVAEAGLEPDQAEQIGAYASTRSPSWARAGGWRARVYSNSLGLLMITLFFGSWLSESLGSWTEYNREQTSHMEATVSWAAYLGTSNFWDRSRNRWEPRTIRLVLSRSRPASASRSSGR
jgi:hypothetical protein